MGVLKHLFGRTTARNDAFGALDLETAHQVVQDYADFLKTSAPLPGRLADERRLPHSKEKIKDALGVCINASSEPELIGHLKNGYLMLSAWQSGIGETEIGVDFSSLDLEADPMEVAGQIQQRSETRNLWDPLIRAEQTELASDLRALGV